MLKPIKADECKDCNELLKPLKGDCDVYCSYGYLPCPPIQRMSVTMKAVAKTKKKFKPAKLSNPPTLIKKRLVVVMTPCLFSLIVTSEGEISNFFLKDMELLIAILN